MDRKCSRSRGLWLVVSAVVTSLWSAGCGDDAVVTCQYGGKTHEIGDLFPSSDGCNMCGCEAGGEVECTNRDCADGEGCDDDGVSRETGERWSADGCRSCICNANGTITCSVSTGCAVSCSYGGQRYVPGTSFPSGDGCNTCTCGTSGEVSCTERACAGACEYANQIFGVGTTFKATDGCNECTCVADRMVKCTTRSCSRCMYNGHSYAEGEEFLIDDGCTSCVCGPSGGSTCDSDGCPEGGCHFGAHWYEPGDEVICPDTCNTCRCEGDMKWTPTGTPAPDCRRRYAELCAAGPGMNRVDASFIYLESDSLAVETKAAGCESSYLLCFNPGSETASPLPVDVWLVQVEGMCTDDQLKTQFVFDMSPLRDHLWPRFPGQTPAVTLQMGGEQLDYSF